MSFENITLPFTNPVLVFSIILFIILFTPLIFNRLSIPHLIGLILAGIIIGPNGFNLIARDSSIILFGTVGMLYIMFISSLEMDMHEFRKNTGKSIVFGFYTFIIPMVLGILTSVYILGFSWLTSVLLASMYASNTLITYPIVSKLGISKNRSVNISVVATVITTVAALLVLAVVVAVSKGNVNHGFWIRMIVSFLLFALIIIFIFPVVGHWFFKNYSESVGQYIFVMAMVFLGSFLAQLAGIEPIVGAFLAGLALNKLIPSTSVLMNRIQFVGNALFIPFFLIGVGMLIDLRPFFYDLNSVAIAIVMTVAATFSKYAAAWLGQKSFGFDRIERNLIFGLTNSQAASTLAAVLVGYNVIIGTDENGESIRLLNDAVLNGTVVMILVTCTIASFVTQKSAQKIAFRETVIDDVPDETDHSERILIPLGNIENVEELMSLAVTIKSSRKQGELIGLHVLDNLKQNPAEEKKAVRLVEKAQQCAASSENILSPMVRYDTNLVNGISNVVKEKKVTDLVIGLHQKKGITDTVLGNLTQGILATCDTTTIIYRAVQPLVTIKRNVVFVPDNAEKEIGFPFWLLKIWNIGRNTGSPLFFYSSEEIAGVLKNIHLKHPVKATFKVFEDWDQFPVLSREIRKDDNLIFIMSRKNYASYHPLMSNIPKFLNTYFNANSYILIFPRQSGITETVFNPANPSMFEPLSENIDKLDELLNTIGKLFRKK